MRKAILVLLAFALVPACFARQAFDTVSDLETAVRQHLYSAGHPDPESVTIGPQGKVLVARKTAGFVVLVWDVPGFTRPDEFPEPDAKALSAAMQNAKSQDQKTLENEYFALVEDIYDAAGEKAPDLETAKNFGQARAKIAKARQNKPGAGQGNKKTADDALEFLDMQLKLQGLDLELREYDSNWRGNAKKHELEKPK